MRLAALLGCLFVGSASAADGWKASVVKQPPPAAVSAEVRDVLADEAVRIVDDHGQKFADIWLRRSVPSAAKPAGPKGPVQFPFLAEGELIGVLELATEGHDYRDQSIAKGCYTMRYGLQPVNGDHLGVSTYRDYSLLLPAAKDTSLALPKRKQLEERSAESAGTTHPAVLIMFTAARAKGAAEATSMVHDSEKNLWSVVLPLKLRVKGDNESIDFPVRVVVVGVAQV
jgi:hypothetical protein